MDRGYQIAMVSAGSKNISDIKQVLYGLSRGGWTYDRVKFINKTLQEAGMKSEDINSFIQSPRHLKFGHHDKTEALNEVLTDFNITAKGAILFDDTTANIYAADKLNISTVQVCKETRVRVISYVLGLSFLSFLSFIPGFCFDRTYRCNTDWIQMDGKWDLALGMGFGHLGLEGGGQSCRLGLIRDGVYLTKCLGLTKGEFEQGLCKLNNETTYCDWMHRTKNR